MCNSAACDWLMDNADTPIRYRTAHELLRDETAARSLEDELLRHPAVRLWLSNLKPQSPPQHRWMEHGSFDFCLENAILKAVQLGLHGGLPQVQDSAGYYLAKLERAAERPQKREDFNAILTSNLLSLAGIEHEAVHRYMTASLDELYRFVQLNPATFYLSLAETKTLTGVPKCWKGKPFIRPELLREHGYAFPLLYDIVGMHSLYRLRDPKIDRQIDAIIRYVSTDAFHRSVADGYGILVEGGGTYHAMGWDPKYPGWLDPDGYFKTGNMPQLLFYALHASLYPAPREAKWFQSLLDRLNAYQTAKGRYAFPALWLTEKQGYAVMGRHLSFGENRRKKLWREIESTFYMQLLTRYLDIYILGDN